PEPAGAAAVRARCLHRGQLPCGRYSDGNPDREPVGRRRRRSGPARLPRAGDEQADRLLRRPLPHRGRRRRHARTVRGAAYAGACAQPERQRARSRGGTRGRYLSAIDPPGGWKDCPAPSSRGATIKSPLLSRSTLRCALAGGTPTLSHNGMVGSEAEHHGQSRNTLFWNRARASAESRNAARVSIGWSVINRRLLLVALSGSDRGIRVPSAFGPIADNAAALWWCAGRSAPRGSYRPRLGHRQRRWSSIPALAPDPARLTKNIRGPTIWEERALFAVG